MPSAAPKFPKPLDAGPHLTDATREKLRAEIAAAMGREVFFVGSLDEGGRVCEVTALARGSEGAVPAIFGQARAGDVIIHNHPADSPGGGADLSPSNADLSLAGSFGNDGVGFFIIDNMAERLYRVAEPLVPEGEEEPIDAEAVARAFAAGGALDAVMTGFEDRSEQREMARAVAFAMGEKKVLAVEAGTGVGKSLAYLVPAWHKIKQSGRRVVVSTATKNLQEQLFTKDLPLLEKAVGEKVRAALVLGRSNYVCKRKAAELSRQMGSPEELSLFDTEEGGEKELSELLAWAARSESGSKSELPFEPSPAAWERIASASDQTLRTACPHYNSCFFYSSRRQAAAADLLVANHHLLLADLALRAELGQYNEAAVLPPFADLVIDEAHHLEEAATGSLSWRVSRPRIERLLSRLASRRDETKGLLSLLEIRLAQHQALADGAACRQLSEKLLPQLREQLRVVRALAAELFPRLSEATRQMAGLPVEEGAAQTSIKLRITEERGGSEFFQHEILPPLLDMAHELSRLSALLTEALRSAARAAEPVKDERALEELRGPLVEISSVQGRLQAVCDDLRRFEGGAPPGETCRWIERFWRRGEPQVELASAPIDLSGELKRIVFDALDSVVLTSATLTVGGRFDFYARRTGVAHLEEERRLNLALQSPFDYGRQALLALPQDLPPPTDPAFSNALAGRLVELAEAAGGGTFFLFTSYGAMRRAFDETAGELTRAGLVPLRQGGPSRSELLRSFKATPHSVLFAVASFWEGVDVPGQALRQVVLCRLPFAVPDEPITEARCEQIEREGGSAFTGFQLPQAVLRLRQGFGRLIRTGRDRGAVVVLDSRILRKHYGRLFLESLPPARRLAGPWPEVLSGVQDFFANG